jgi:hypothetical protein
MKCANCDRDALYTIKRPSVNTVNYCQFHLPLNLKDAADKGMHPLDVPVVEAPVVEKPSKKKSAPVEEAPTEEPVVAPE